MAFRPSGALALKSWGQSDQSGPDVNFNVTDALFHVPNEPRFAPKAHIVILHDSEPRDVHREAHRGTTHRRAPVGAAASQRGRQVRRASLPGTKTVPASLRASEQGQQGDRTRSHRKLPGRAELGIQRRLSSLGALAADS
jgi:hypothetical protein